MELKKINRWLNRIGFTMYVVVDKNYDTARFPTRIEIVRNGKENVEKHARKMIDIIHTVQDRHYGFSIEPDGYVIEAEESFKELIGKK